MGKDGQKRSRRGRRPSRRAKRILERANLEARVLVSEARAESVHERLRILTDAHADAERVRSEVQVAALRTMEQAHEEAGWILAQARKFVEAEVRAATAEAELAAERVKVAANAAAEQLRREAVAAREQAVRELEVERARLRDEALLESARSREQARAEAEAVIAAADAERRAVIEAAEEEARRVAAQSADARADREIEDFLHSRPAASSGTATTPEFPPSDEVVNEVVNEQTVGTHDLLPADTLEVRDEDGAEDDRRDFWDDRVPDRPRRRWWQLSGSR